MFLSVDAALTLRSRAQRVTCDGALRTSFLLTSLFTAACASVRGRDAALLLAAITVLGAVAGTAVGRAVGSAVGRAVRPALDAAVRTAVGTAVDTAIGAGPWAHSLVGRWAGWCTGCDARALIRCKLVQAAGTAFLLPAAPLPTGACPRLRSACRRVAPVGAEHVLRTKEKQAYACFGLNALVSWSKSGVTCSEVCYCWVSGVLL